MLMLDVFTMVVFAAGIGSEMQLENVIRDALELEWIN